MSETEKRKYRPKRYSETAEARKIEENLRDDKGLLAIWTISIHVFDSLLRYCGKCEKEIKAKDKKHCLECGAEIDRSPKILPYKVMKVLICPKCGDRYEVDAAVCCGECGAKLELKNA